MSDALYSVTYEFIKSNVQLLPNTERFIKKDEQLYPITHKFIKKVKGEFYIIVNSDRLNRSFILPTSGRLNDMDNSYAWIVDWGDGTIEEHSGTGTNASGIEHVYPQANTQYRVEIRPQNASELGWLRAFGFGSARSHNDRAASRVMVVGGQLTEQMIRTSPSDTFVCANWFYGCYNLKVDESFNLPQNLTSVGDGFCSSMFYGCGLTNMNDIFNLPQNITSVGDFFCSSMFRATPITAMNSVFNLPQNLTRVGDGFCNGMFLDCHELTNMNDIFNLPQGITRVGYSFCASMFSRCYKLTNMNTIFQLPQNLSAINVGMFFCDSAFYDCSSLKTGVVHFFGSLALEFIHNSRWYWATFANCISLTEILSDIPQLQVIPDDYIVTFANCPPNLIAPLYTYWK